VFPQRFFGHSFEYVGALGEELVPAALGFDLGE
jgi:hypothetical protein